MFTFRLALPKLALSYAARARAQIVHSDSLCPRMGMFTFFFRARAQSEQSEHANFENFLEFFNQNKTQKLPMLGGKKNKF